MVSTTTYFILISSGVNITFNFILVIFLIVNFIRKKTIGTALLLTSYVLFFTTNLASIMYRLHYIMNQEDSVLVEMFATLGPLILLPAFGFLYPLACRHILKDSELTRTFFFSALFAFYGAASALVGYDVALNPLVNDRFFVDKVFLVPGELYTASYLHFILITQVVVSILVTGRIGFRALRLAKKSDQPVRKRGLQTIGIGVLLYLLGGMLSAFDSTIIQFQALMIIVVVLRALSFSAAYVAMYLGWIMPNWYRKMVRKKSWFEMQYEGMTKR